MTSDLTRLTELARIAAQMPEQLAQARTIVGNMKASLEALSNDIKDREAETLSLVSAETQPDTDPIARVKPMFSNKEVREAEVRRRLKTNAIYQQLLLNEGQMQHDKRQAEIHLNRLQDEDRAIDRQLEAVTAAVRAVGVQTLRQAIIDLTTVEARRFAQGESHG